MGRLSVLEKCSENMRKIEKIINDDGIGNIIKVMTEPLKERIQKIENICSVDRYSLCFIGEVGIGKSTAISNLVGMINHDNLSEGKKLSKIPLLKTAEGRTTLCETNIIFTDDRLCKIVIEKLPHKEFLEIVNDYCDVLIKDVNNEEKISLPVEVQRAIRNMSHYPQSGTDEEKSIYILNTSDKLNLKQRIKESILKNIQYEDRNRLILECEEESTNTEWLQKTIENINYGQEKGVPYPSKLEIYVNRNNYGKKVPEFIDKILDTRGIDGVGAREDLISYCNDINTFCILCDSIKDYGNLINNTFLRNQFISRNRDLKYRNLLLGIEQGIQLKKVNGADGRESGKDIKKDEAIENWKNICLDKENMYFYNAFLGIKYDNEECFSSINQKEYDQEQESVFKKIETMINNMYDAYSEELKEINIQLSVFSENKINDVHKNKLLEICDIINICRNEITPNYKNCMTELENEMKNSINASILRASVNRNGEYFNYNIYSETRDKSLKEFDDICKEKIYHIDKKIDEILNSFDQLEGALKKALEYFVDNQYKEYRKIDAEDYSMIMRDALIGNSIWSLLQKYWGNSNGMKYRDRVTQDIIAETRVKRVIDTITAKCNIYKFFNALIEFTDINRLL